MDDTPRRSPRSVFFFYSGESVPTYHLQLGVGIRQKDNFNLKWTIQWEFLTLFFSLNNLFWTPWTCLEAILNFIRIFMELFLSQNFDNSTPCYQWQHRVKTPCCCYNSEAKLYVLSCSGYWEGGLRCTLIRCTLGSGKSEKGRDFGGEGTKGQWGTKGSGLPATWDWGGRFLSQLEGAK
jgi:hypothetical protein